MFEKKACKGHGICPYQQEIAKPRHESANGKLKSSTTIFFTAFSNLSLFNFEVIFLLTCFKDNENCVWNGELWGDCSKTCGPGFQDLYQTGYKRNDSNIPCKRKKLTDYCDEQDCVGKTQAEGSLK